MWQSQVMAICVEDEVVNFLFLIAASRLFLSLLLKESQIWVSYYQSILPTVSLCGSHLPLFWNTSSNSLKVFQLLAEGNSYQHVSQNKFLKLQHTQIIFLVSWLLSSLMFIFRAVFSYFTLCLVLPWHNFDQWLQTLHNLQLSPPSL